MKEALTQHPTTRNDGMEDPTTSRDGTGTVPYVGDRFKLQNDGRSTRAGEGMVSSSHRLFFLNKHVEEALIEHPTTRNDGIYFLFFSPPFSSSHHFFSPYFFYIFRQD